MYSLSQILLASSNEDSCQSLVRLSLTDVVLNRKV